MGVLFGSILFWISEQIPIDKLENPEVALGEMCYEELQKYPDEINIEKVMKVVQEIALKKRTFQPKKQRDEVLLELASKEAERLAKINLQRAEDFLAACSEKAFAVVPDKVYIEILEDGSGEKVSQTDFVSIEFKQYDLKGKIIKDSKNQSVKIPLARMIKGFKIGLEGAKVGERRKVYIHPEYGFGKIGRGEEPNQLLIYEVKINKICNALH